MNASTQRACVWSGVAFAILFFVGFGLIAGYIPPPQPSDDAATVAARYREHANAIRFGMVLSLYGLVFYVPWAAAVSVQLKRIEGRYSPLAYAQLALGAGLPVAFFPGLYYFQTAAFRGDRSDQAVQMLNDMGWLPFTGIIYAIFVANLVVAIAVLSDSGSSPVYPRWYGYLSIWCALLYCPASLDVFFQNGPLAWNGLLSWWLSLVAFFAWLIVTTVLTFRAITAQALEALPTSRGPLDVERADVDAKWTGDSSEPLALKKTSSVESQAVDVVMPPCRRVGKECPVSAESCLVCWELWR